MGFPLDDAWIHQSIARNLGGHFELSFNRGELTTGSTSLLWTSILSLNFAFIKVDPVYFTLTVNILLYFLTATFLYKLLSKEIDKLTSFIIVILFSLTGTVGFFVFSGMEVFLFYFLSIASVYFFVEKRFSITGFLCGLLILTRPEGLGLFLIFIVVTLYKSFPKIDKKTMLFLMIPPIIFLGVSVSINFYISGSFLPTTFMGRKWLYLLSNKLFYLDLNQTWSFLSSWCFMIKKYTFGIHKSGSLIINLLKNGTNYLLFLFIFIGSLRILKNGLWCYEKKERKGIFLLFIWSVALNLLYIFFLPAASHAGRYQPLNYLLVSLTMVLGIQCIAQRVFKRLRFTKGALSLSGMILLFIFLNNALFWAEVTKVSIFHINNTHKRMALYLKSHLPENEKVAVFDIGAIKYFSSQNIVDLGGLIDKKIIPYLFSWNSIPYLQDRGVKYIVLPFFYHYESENGWKLGFFRKNSKVRLIKIKEFSTPEDIWKLVRDTTYNADPRQILFEIKY